MSTTHDYKTRRISRFVWIIIASVAAILAIVLTVASCSPVSGGPEANLNGAKPKATPTATSTADPEACGDARFQQVVIDRASTAQVDPRYDPSVRPIVNDASLSNDQKIAEIHKVELELAASNAQTLAFWAFGAGIYDNPNKWPELVEGGKIVEGSCLSEAGKMLLAKYDGAQTASGVTTVIDESSENVRNTGVNGDTAVIDYSQGVYGDRVSIRTTYKDGTVMEKLVRCGNLVFPSPPPGIPPGTTDNPPPPAPPETPVCPPDMPHGEYPNCKDAPSQDPGPRGHAPDGGGQNADPGPGVYIPPAQMEQPPSTPRPNPAPPAPEPPAPAPAQPNQPAPKPVPTKDPAPAPKPEPSAPAPSDPVGPSDPGGGCIPIPGVEDC